MSEIKFRVNVINYLYTGRGSSLYDSTTIESICLQIRKILEIIAFGSLIANKDIYTKIYSNFSKAWNAESLLRDLSNVNQDFYPMAIKEILPSSLDVEDSFIYQDKALTKEEFFFIYKKCGAIMHASNPYRPNFDYDYYKENIRVWMEKIMSLLFIHMVKLVDDSRFYLVRMGGDDTEEVHWCEFVLQPTLPR